MSILVLIDLTPGFSDRANRDDLSTNEPILDLPSLNLRLNNDLSEFENSNYIDRVVKRFMARNELTGVSLAIAKDEKLVFARGYGFADLENKIPTGPEHLFRVASVSKLITACAVMKLVENGKLRLDDKVFGNDGIVNDSIYQPYKDKSLVQISVRNLLNHSGGWTQKYGDPIFVPNRIADLVGDEYPATIETYLKFITSRRLHFKPGTMSSYSNMGYVLLSEVISRVSGMPYQEYVKTHILLPAGITDMHIGNSFHEDKFTNEVRYYEPEGALHESSYDGSGRICPKSDGGNNIQLLGAAGGWVASPVELMKLMTAIDGNPVVKDILSEASIIEMTTPHKGFHPLGWRATNAYGVWFRTGSMPGTAAMMKRRADGLEWVFVSNTSNWQGPKFSRSINSMMGQIFRKVKVWPEHDLFEYYKPKDVLALYQQY